MQLTAKRLRGAASGYAEPEPRPDRSPVDEALAQLPVGWAVIRNCVLPAARENGPETRMPAALLHRAFGVVLLEFEPYDTQDAARRFEQLLRPEDLEAMRRDHAVVLRIRLAPRQARKLGRALDEALGMRRRGPAATGDWLPPVLDTLSPAATGVAESTGIQAVAGDARPEGGRRASWIGGLVGVGVAAVALPLLWTADGRQSGMPVQSPPQAGPAGVEARAGERPRDPLPSASPGRESQPPSRSGVAALPEPAAPARDLPAQSETDPRLVSWERAWSALRQAPIAATGSPAEAAPLDATVPVMLAMDSRMRPLVAAEAMPAATTETAARDGASAQPPVPAAPAEPVATPAPEPMSAGQPSPEGDAARPADGTPAGTPGRMAGEDDVTTVSGQGPAEAPADHVAAPDPPASPSPAFASADPMREPAAQPAAATPAPEPDAIASMPAPRAVDDAPPTAAPATDGTLAATPAPTGIQSQAAPQRDATLPAVIPPSDAPIAQVASGEAAPEPAREPEAAAPPPPAANVPSKGKPASRGIVVSPRAAPPMPASKPPAAASPSVQKPSNASPSAEPPRTANEAPPPERNATADTPATEPPRQEPATASPSDAPRAPANEAPSPQEAQTAPAPVATEPSRQEAVTASPADTPRVQPAQLPTAPMATAEAPQREPPTPAEAPRDEPATALQPVPPLALPRIPATESAPQKRAAVATPPPAAEPPARQDAQASLPPATPRTLPAEAPPRPEAPPAATASPGESMSPAMLSALIRRGDDMMEVGDISAARLLYERAAQRGSGAAALALGRTYDPEQLARSGARGPRGDAEIAERWYRRAAELGDPTAQAWLRRTGQRR